MFVRQNSKEIEELKQAFASIPNINILVTVYNWDDGVGDARNAIDAYQAMKAIAPQHSVKLLAKVGEKKSQSVLNLLSYNELGPNTFIYKAQYNDGDSISFDISQHSVILVEHDHQNFKDDSQMKRFIDWSSDFKEFLQNTHLVFNVATEFELSSAEISLHLPENCQIESILEYCCGNGLSSRGKFNWKGRSRSMDEKIMGVKQDEIGLKLNDSLYKKAESFDPDKQPKSEVLSSVSNKVLSQLLGTTDATQMTADNIDRHLNDHLLCAGYVQSHDSLNAEYYLSYALHGLAENKKKSRVDVFLPSTDLAHWRELAHDLELMSSLPNNDAAILGKIYLSAEGDYVVRDNRQVQTGKFDKNLIKDGLDSNKLKDKQFLKDILEITSKAGHARELKDYCIKIHHADKPVEELGSGKFTINIHHANGISNDDLEKLMLAADCVCGSGDNSISDMFSVKRLPFISVLKHKSDFMRSLIDCNLSQDESYGGKLYELRRYFHSLHVLRFSCSKQWSGEGPSHLLEDSADYIAEGARLFAEYLYQKKNVQTYFLQSFLNLANNINVNISRESNNKISQVSQVSQVSQAGMFANTTTANKTTTSKIALAQQSTKEF